MKGKWRNVEMPDYESGFLDAMEPAYIAFDGEGSAAFAFGCVTGANLRAGESRSVEISGTGIARPWQTSSTAC